MVASLKDSPQCIAVYRVVGLMKINEAHVERLMELPCLLHEDSQRVNLVIIAMTFAETALALTEKSSTHGFRRLEMTFMKTLLGTLSKEIPRSQSD